MTVIVTAQTYVGNSIPQYPTPFPPSETDDMGKYGVGRAWKQPSSCIDLARDIKDGKNNLNYADMSVLEGCCVAFIPTACQRTPGSIPR